MMRRTIKCLLISLLIVFTLILLNQTVVKLDKATATYWWHDWFARDVEDTRFIGSSTIARMPLWQLTECGITRALGFENGTAASVKRYLFGANFNGVEKIVLYIGENDLAQGQTPQFVFNEIQDIINTLRLNSDADIAIMLIKYSPVRERFHAEMRQLNVLIRQHYAENKEGDGAHNIHLVNFDLLDADRFYVTDGVHLNQRGYKALSTLIDRFCHATGIGR